MDSTTIKCIPKCGINTYLNYDKTQCLCVDGLVLNKETGNCEISKENNIIDVLSIILYGISFLIFAIVFIVIIILLIRNKIREKLKKKDCKTQIDEEKH